jgi:hypothetical protein
VNDLIVHLEAQVASGKRLLEIVLAQGEAIRIQDVSGLVARLGDVQQELLTRRQLELERDRLIHAAAGRLAATPDTVDLDAMLVGASPIAAEQARTLGVQLRDLMAEVARVHSSNRVLIRQELTFVDHLLRVLSGVPQAGYSPAGWATRQAPVTSVDARG